MPIKTCAVQRDDALGIGDGWNAQFRQIDTDSHMTSQRRHMLGRKSKAIPSSSRVAAVSHCVIQRRRIPLGTGLQDRRVQLRHLRQQRHRIPH